MTQSLRQEGVSSLKQKLEIKNKEIMQLNTKLRKQEDQNRQANSDLRHSLARLQDQFNAQKLLYEEKITTM